MKAFYIDEVLTEKEAKDTIQVLNVFGFNTVESLEFRHIPLSFPMDGNAVAKLEMATNLRDHLKHSGVTLGQKSLFIIPRDGLRWSMLMQQAFENITGYLPVIVQPWEYVNKELVRRGNLMITNMDKDFNSQYE
jgi:hypothetical protein